MNFVRVMAGFLLGVMFCCGLYVSRPPREFDEAVAQNVANGKAQMIVIGVAPEHPYLRGGGRFSFIGRGDIRPVPNGDYFIRVYADEGEAGKVLARIRRAIEGP